MSRSAILYDRAGALRAPWRVLVFSIASLVALFIAQFTFGPLISGFFSLAGLHGVSNDESVICIGVLGGTAFALRYVDKRPWRDVWLGREAARPSLLGLGFAVGVFSIGLPTALLIVAHWMRNVGAPPGSVLAAGIRVSIILLPAALVEELICRGYLLSVLRESWGWLAAIVVTSVAFGLLHLANNGASASSVALVTLAGFYLAGIVYATRSLYAAWMAHFAWNWTMAVLFHTAVSGYPLESPRYRYVDAGPDWATGGEWGPEGGVPAALGMIAGMSFLVTIRRRALGATSHDGPEREHDA